MTKGIIYYTDNRLTDPILSVAQELIAASGLPITSVSLKPIDFGNNFVLDLQPNIVTMVKQIVKGLKESKEEYVFFCEHDVLYPYSHFEFTPTSDTVWYYNQNVVRWRYPENVAVSYDRMISLSCLCVNRKFALDHYSKRLRVIEENGWDQNVTREPIWARKWGYEPGAKKRRRGGFSDDDFETWRSEIPVIDVRHGKTFSPSKVTLDSFKHAPQNWKEFPLDTLPGWNIQSLIEQIVPTRNADELSKK